MGLRYSDGICDGIIRVAILAPVYGALCDQPIYNTSDMLPFLENSRERGRAFRPWRLFHGPFAESDDDNLKRSQAFLNPSILECCAKTFVEKRHIRICINLLIVGQ